MLEELGISAGTGILMLIALYFVIRIAVKGAVVSALEDYDVKKKIKKALREIQEERDNQPDDDSEEDYSNYGGE